MRSNHSHACRMNENQVPMLFWHYESFPRLWDERRVPLIQLVQVRIIPTPVGWTQPMKKGFSTVSNHSHACGMNIMYLITYLITYESFPRLWDEHFSADRTAESGRIIPTPVGWTTLELTQDKSFTNHSHACGMNPINSTHHNVNNTIYCGFSVLGILNCIFLTPERFRLEFLICNHVIPNACR